MKLIIVQHIIYHSFCMYIIRSSVKKIKLIQVKLYVFMLGIKYKVFFQIFVSFKETDINSDRLSHCPVFNN